ncbi:MAG: PorT family protein [Bacteroidota bacterium]|nr:PorT family protein [Bacteroidota bacterium]
MFKFILLSLTLLFCTWANAQSDLIGYGFRAGLSFAKIDGPSELGATGSELETNKMSTGFHIGMTINFKFTDIMGFRTELLYSQRGTQYEYNGPSYFVLEPNSLNTQMLLGNRRQSLNVSNAYLDVPLLVYYRIGYFEISGGLNTGLLISSTAGGSIEFDGTSPNTQNPVAPFEVNLNHNYRKDEAREASPDNNIISVDGIPYDVPEFLGAYYDFDSKDGSFYKTLDFGINLGLAYYLNDGLFISGKYIIGLNDVTNNFYDVSKSSLSNGTLIPRSDNDKSSSMQFSLGFNF